MRVIGFNFTQINAEKQKKISGKVEIKTEIDISNITEVKREIIDTKDSILEVSFKYEVKYEPNVANVSLNGNVFLTLDPKTAKEILKRWKKKQIPEDFKIFFFNVVLKRAALKALILEDELNLPLHTPMPFFRKPEEK